MVYFHYQNIYKAHSFFFSTQPGHSNNAVQQAVSLIATLINDKALIMIRKSKMQCRTGFKNVNARCSIDMLTALQ